VSECSAAVIGIEPAAAVNGAVTLRLEALGHGNIVTLVGNGYRDSGNRPRDSLIVTAARLMPTQLLGQLGRAGKRVLRIDKA
jgi:protein-L-isoaspartate O-methyltransferase